jgi:hypothetical protein
MGGRTTGHTRPRLILIGGYGESGYATQKVEVCSTIAALTGAKLLRRANSATTSPLTLSTSLCRRSVQS